MQQLQNLYETSLSLGRSEQINTNFIHSTTKPLTFIRCQTSANATNLWRLGACGLVGTLRGACGIVGILRGACGAVRCANFVASWDCGDYCRRLDWKSMEIQSEGRGIHVGTLTCEKAKVEFMIGCWRLRAATTTTTTTTVGTATTATTLERKL